MSIDTEANRKTAENLVRNEIVCCVSMLVSAALESGWSTPDHPAEELYDLAYKVDYCEAAASDLQDRIDGADLSDPDIQIRDDIDEAMEWAWREDYVTDEQKEADDFQALVRALYGREAAQEYCREFDVDTDDYEIESLEYWVVSHMMADDLEELGEPILRNWHGLTIWGRSTSGQAISMDHIMLVAADRLNKRTAS